MNNLIVGLDVPSLKQAKPLVISLAKRVAAFKIGPVLFGEAGPAAIDLVHKYGGKVFLDLKWHDIPNTVAGACRTAAMQGVWMVNVHASGGLRMLLAAREALEQAQIVGRERPLLLAVTLLTSLEKADLLSINVTSSVQQHVTRLSELAVTGGADGLVASGHEVSSLRTQWQDLVIAVPGVRPNWLSAQNASKVDDQRRVSTPKEVLNSGASYVIMVRPIINHPDPELAVRLTEEEIS